MFKLLLLDDDSFELDLLKEIIPTSDFNIEIVNSFMDGNKAIDYLSSHHVDIIISDVKMPSPNGIEIAKLCYEKYPKTKVILISGHSDFEAARSAVQYDVVNYIKKPIDYDELYHTLSKVVDKLTIPYFPFPMQSDLLIENFSKYIKSHLTSILTSDFSETYKKACVLISELIISSDLPNENMKSDDIIAKAIEYMQENIDKKISLSNVAEYVHFSPKYFSRYFKNKLEKRFVDVLTDMRMEKALHLLKNTNYPIEKICELIGYTSVSHFYATFREYHGVTPNTYRN